MFAVKVVEIENELGVILPEEAVSHLGLTDDATLVMSRSDDGAMWLKSVGDDNPDD